MKAYVIVLTIVMLSGFVLAAPPFSVTGDTTSGYTIKFPIRETYRMGQGYNFEFHVYDKVNGTPVTSGISCYMHIYNQSGNHIYNGFQNKTSNLLDYDFTVNSANFTTVGQYYYYITCNNSIKGGYEGDYIYVTAQGVPYTETHGIVYSALFILLMGIFALQLFFIFTIETNDTRSNEGKVLNINYKKYIRIFLICFSYVTFIAINYFAWNIAYGILEFTEMANFFMVMFRITYALMYPIFIVIIIWSIAQYIKDKKHEEFLRRHLSFK